MIETILIGLIIVVIAWLLLGYVGMSEPIRVIIVLIIAVLIFLYGRGGL